MQILMLTDNDPAGTAITFTNAVNRLTPHTCRLVTRRLAYNFMFEKDLHLPWMAPEDLDELEHLLKTSDVFHFHMTSDEFTEFGPFVPADYLRGKLVVHHHHGHPDFRGNPLKYQQKYRERKRSKLLVSTPDLLKLLPGARWLPNMVPLHDVAYLPTGGKQIAPVLIAHSPTRKELKNTDDLIRVMDELRGELGEGAAELRTIEMTAHLECLRRKRRCHILFDHLQGYYGVSSLEALSQGLVVISGLDAWNAGHVREFAGTDELPWVVTDVPGLKDTLRALTSDPDFLRERGAASRRFMLDHWTQEKIARRLVEFYAV